ncbi:hypothetical protein [Streptomyces sp. NPDC005438]|uniref:hypothetical protein n=1 Tax=Streptomyces sp. NPDC005438 TaxID=3156880 RepID=UPI0033A25E7B
MSASPLPDAQLRHRSNRFVFRLSAAVTLGLLAWLVNAFLRQPPASGVERFLAILLTVSFSGCTLMVWWSYLKPLPALDRTPRPATVTGRRTFDGPPDADGNHQEPYDLVAVTLELDGATVESLIADIVVGDDLDRFVPGSTWIVYAFEDPAALNGDPDQTRVLLTEAHDDVIRGGYDLGRSALRGGVAGPGSELLQRRFTNDPHP